MSFTRKSNRRPAEHYIFTNSRSTAPADVMLQPHGKFQKFRAKAIWEPDLYPDLVTYEFVYANCTKNNLVNTK